MKKYFNSKDYADNMIDNMRKKLKQEEEQEKNSDKIMNDYVYGKPGKYGIPLILSLLFTLSCYILIGLSSGTSSYTNIVVRLIIVTICGIILFFKTAI